MSPPINTPGGSEVSEIVLPDGSTASEVIGPDGNVVFEAGADIPDSVVVDNFEDAEGDEPLGVYGSGETVADYYNGSTGEWERTTSNVVEGGHALQKSSDVTENAIWSLPGDGLNQYLSEGDTVDALTRIPANNPANVLCLNVEDSASPGCYGFYMSNATQEIRIYKVSDLTDVSNSPTQLQATSVSINNQTWYIADIGLPTSSDDQISYTLYENDNLSKGAEVGTVTANDNEYAAGSGVGMYFMGTGDDASMFDRIRVTT